jgi:hypothetical protein
MKKISTVRKTCFLFFPFLLIGWMLGNGASLWAAGGEGKTYSFPEMAGWKQSGEIQTFSRANLYDYINGGADLFLKYDFQELKVADYENHQKASVTIEIYRHKSPLHAFGIYSQERLSSANYLEVGVQGYGEKRVLNFLAADCYVKMSSVDVGPEEREVLLAFAKKVVENLGGKGSLPSICPPSPAKGKRKIPRNLSPGNFWATPFFIPALRRITNFRGRNSNFFLSRGQTGKSAGI